MRPFRFVAYHDLGDTPNVVVKGAAMGARLIDVSAAGDCATFADRDSMRVAMAIAVYDDPARH